MDITMPVGDEGVALVVVDVQERLVKAMGEFTPYRDTLRRALQMAPLLGLDVWVTEQYPQGLGATIPELKELLPGSARVFTKTAFSCWGCADFAAAVDAVRPRHLLLTGLETHVCVQQTALDCLARGYNPVLLADAVCSRKSIDREMAIAFLRRAGAAVTTLEAVAFQLLRDAAHPRFRDVARLFR